MYTKLLSFTAAALIFGSGLAAPSCHKRSKQPSFAGGSSSTIAAPSAPSSAVVASVIASSAAAPAAPPASSAAAVSSVSSAVPSSQAAPAPAAAPAAAAGAGSLEGQATTYGGNLNGGDCSFTTMKSLPAGLYGTALSSDNWNSSANCGGCIAVTYQGKSIKAMIVDECPGCGPNHLDLFPDAYAQLSPNPGIIDVSWDYAPCTEVTGPLTIHMKSGSTQYWLSAQVVNGNDRTANLEYSTDGNTWQEMTRQDYNFFQSNGAPGSKSVSFRATSFGGSQVVVKNVQISSDGVATAASNYS